ncbi:MAG: U32 family peptidase [Gemmataceae bacterium]|nr:U32 family peptidase [Gemmataceae bacterium]
MQRNSLNLPLVTDVPASPSWQGFRPAADWDDATSAPEPAAPQGEYASIDMSAAWSPADVIPSDRPVELLSPAGGPDAAFAAFHHGADAIYLGLQKFSARAEAENFSLDQVAEATAYAHSLEPRRRVFVTINTVLRQDEIPELIRDLAALAEIGVDALIVQDLGVAALARRHFPELELHASTQLAVHNRAGAMALGRLGFTRVVLARELTIEEVHDITATAGIESEVFIHGALCYSYSGLCLFSAQTLARSGNRGKCAYSCRDSYSVADAPATLRDGAATRRDPATGFPFSMKDLALPDHLPTLRAAGVSCFKIEGRKKSPLYVATTTSYYRGLLDHTIPADERPAREADLQTVFSRPWTKLFTQSHKDKEVADRDTVGHRGTLIGRVESVREGRLTFVTTRSLQKHDGLQVDLAQLGKPFGFPVDAMWMVGPGDRRRPVFTAPAGARVEVALPAGYPNLPDRGPVYCSSSQDVKQRYRFDRPKAGQYRTRHPIDIAIQVSADRLTATGTSYRGVVAKVEMPVSLTPARTAGDGDAVARDTLGKLGESSFTLGRVTIDNPANLFVPSSLWNKLRKAMLPEMEYALARGLEGRIVEVMKAEAQRVPAAGETSRFAWSLKTDRLAHLAAFEADDWRGWDELVVDIARDHPAELASGLEEWATRIGRERIRIALPAITRKWEERGLVAKIEKLRAAGWTKWEISNVSGLTYLNPTEGLDLATDWPVYVLNRPAAAAVREWGVTRFALSPEDGKANIAELVAGFPEQAVVIVHQDTPLFIAESCAYANLIGGCPGKANCKFESMTMESSHGERVTAIDYHCRTIVLNDGPYCLAPRLRELEKIGARNVRVDLIFRKYDAAEACDRWRAVRAGRPVAGGHAGNFERGLL